MVLGDYYESSGQHIGTPYIDKLGKGQPLTVCNGVTGKGVVAGKYYTKEDCYKLELPRYLEAEKQAQQLFYWWDTYNMWVQGSIIDMIYNLGAPTVAGSTLRKKANRKELDLACAEMSKWIYGTVNGKKTMLPGLEDRRSTTRELCAEWGRTGHFSNLENLDAE